MTRSDFKRRATKETRGAHTISHSEEATGHRVARLEQLLREEIGSLVRDETTDPTLDGVRVSAVVLSVDYKNARVHYTRIGRGEVARAERERLARALVRATPFLRARLAEAVDLKRVPDLRFVFDGTVPGGDDDDDGNAEAQTDATDGDDR